MIVVKPVQMFVDPLICYWCDYQFITLNEYDKHTKEKHGITIWKRIDEQLAKFHKVDDL